MNKKASFFEIILIMIFIIIVIILIVGLISLTIEDRLKNDACKKIRYEKRGSITNIDFCKDKQGNLHFVEIECDYIFYVYATSCQAKEISVGDVRIIKNE